MNEVLIVNYINMKKKKNPEDYLFCVKCYINFLIILNSHLDPLQLVYYTGQVLYSLNQGLQLVQSHPVFTKKTELCQCIQPNALRKT